MRVACGLDFLVLGELQILGQVKQAFIQTLVVVSLSMLQWKKLFQKSFSVAKRVRTETEIGEVRCLYLRSLYFSQAYFWVDWLIQPCCWLVLVKRLNLYKHLSANGCTKWSGLTELVSVL